MCSTPKTGKLLSAEKFAPLTLGDARRHGRRAVRSKCRRRAMKSPASRCWSRRARSACTTGIRWPITRNRPRVHPRAGVDRGVCRTEGLQAQCSTAPNTGTDSSRSARVVLQAGREASRQRRELYPRVGSGEGEGSLARQERGLWLLRAFLRRLATWSSPATTRASSTRVQRGDGPEAVVGADAGARCCGASTVSASTASSRLRSSSARVGCPSRPKRTNRVERQQLASCWCSSGVARRRCRRKCRRRRRVQRVSRSIRPCSRRAMRTVFDGEQAFAAPTAYATGARRRCRARARSRRTCVTAGCCRSVMAGTRPCATASVRRAACRRFAGDS